VLPKQATGLPSKFTSHPFHFIDHKVQDQIQKQQAGQHAVKPPLPGKRFFMDFGFMQSSTSNFSHPNLATDWVASEVQHEMIIMGHQILFCHVPVVRSFFIL
jgi:hypothetical protein